ncbi:MAG: mechanosensitive ion channel family protein [Thermoanaerobaculia bacterium]
MTRRFRALSAACLAAAGFATGSARGLPGGAVSRPTEPPTAAPAELASIDRAVPVVLGGARLFDLDQPIGSFTVEERAAAVASRIEAIAEDAAFDPANLTVVRGRLSDDVFAGERPILSVTDVDATSAGRQRGELATEVAKSVRAGIVAYRAARTPRAVLIGAARAALTLVLLILALVATSRGFPRLTRAAERWSERGVPALKVRGREILSSRRLAKPLVGAIRTIRFIVVLALIYAAVPLILASFPWTERFADRAIRSVVDPVSAVGSAFVGYLPKAFFIGGALGVAYFLLRAIHYAFDEIAGERVRFDRFPADWAEPTYKLVRFLVLAFTMVVVFPYLPGSGSPAFQSVSIFLGILVSFGSTSAVSNIVAGIVITYMRPFREGDRVRIGDTVGDVIERTLLVTRVRTIKNEDVTVPNSMVLGSHVVNFSSSATERGLILHTAVTIGYDTPWRRVHDLLIAAALGTEAVLRTPSPFVLQTALDDDYVRYELNAYTDQPGKMAATYSNLHSQIQDRFHEAGVEILSPKYAALRDGSGMALPADLLPTDARAPSFRARDLGGEPADPAASDGTRSA